jgi:molybdopterin molybdotransferase
MAVLAEDFSFMPALQYFLQVKLKIDSDGRLWATPFEGNGSGDFSNLAEADAFMELPMERNNFTKGEVFTIWPFKEILL